MSEIENDLAHGDKIREAKQIHKDVKKILAKPRGNTNKRALFWMGKKPTAKAPKNFVRVMTEKRLEKKNIMDLFFPGEINSEI